MPQASICTATLQPSRCVLVADDSRVTLSSALLRVLRRRYGGCRSAFLYDTTHFASRHRSSGGGTPAEAEENPDVSLAIEDEQGFDHWIAGLITSPSRARCRRAVDRSMGNDEQAEATSYRRC
jgi:hypothetical protein